MTVSFTKLFSGPKLFVKCVTKICIFNFVMTIFTTIWSLIVIPKKNRHFGIFSSKKHHFLIWRNYSGRKINLKIDTKKYRQITEQKYLFFYKGHFLISRDFFWNVSKWILKFVKTVKRGLFYSTGWKILVFMASDCA